MKLVKVLSVFALSSLIFNSCSTAGTSASILNTKKSTLYNTTWKLLEDDEIVKGFNNNDVFLTIDADEFKVSGYAGCNNFTTTAELNNNNITFGNIASTQMLCPNSKTEDSFLHVLDDVNRYEIKGNELYFYKGNMLLLKFKH
ncbi:META domain-containing protein [Faecalibacter rhinopitheci]|uniref:META domain-containing protein n=1 Tax=Faecalibacter rhinopitheci TaxID=2779678 RepID=A0A8J7FSN9_9FLAO|nr:META domain-containing protein [Faecalibacter rhinopitheci]MBF0598153.1 META domain-containing protein [Faecalibacter rhinopitheci]MBQ0148343.1 META domain-containing protein [Candidatus Onthonaster equi]